jgi:hypothetical protein
MGGIGQILEDYEKGNFDRRLSLYLLHRDLRRELRDIEKKDALANMKVLGMDGHQKDKDKQPFYKWPFALLKNRTGV